MRMAANTKAEWVDEFAAKSIEKQALKGFRRANRALWLKPEIRVRTSISRPRARKTSM